MSHLSGRPPAASRLPAAEISHGFVAAWVGGALAAAGGYAALRYVVLGPVPWRQLPLYVANKALALAGLVLLVAAQCYRRPVTRQRLGCWGAGLTLAHVLASVALLKPSYFTGWFTSQGRFTLAAGAALLCGVAAAVLLGGLWLVSVAGPPATRSGGSLVPGGGSLVLALTALHLLCMGASGWLAPSRWHGWLPPITLLGFVLAVAGLLVRRLRTGPRRSG